MFVLVKKTVNILPKCINNAHWKTCYHQLITTDIVSVKIYHQHSLNSVINMTYMPHWCGLTGNGKYIKTQIWKQCLARKCSGANFQE